MGLYVEGYFNDFAFVEEYNWLICASLVGLQIRDMQTGGIIKVLSQDTAIQHFDISQDNRRLVFTQGIKLVDGDLIPLNMYVYSLPDFQEISELKGTDGILQTHFTENAQEVVLVSYYGDKNYPVQIYSIPEKKYTKNITVLKEFFQYMQMSPDWKNIITVSTSNVNFFDIETGELKKKITSGHAFNVDFNPTGKFYVVCVYNQTTFFNYDNYEAIMQINFDEYGSAKFLNNNNKQLLVFNKLRKLKMLHFDFDSLATGVEIKEDIPVIYPNPTMGYVMIPNDGNNILKITISDYTGRDFPAIYTMETGEKTNSIRLNVTMIPNGTYLVTIQDGKFPKSYKLIKGE
jgi:WD40 repeat protein